MSRSLARQSILVAAASALIDVCMLALSGIFAVAPWETVGVLILVAAIDLALAAPERTAGVVAVLQVGLRLGVSMFLHHHGLAPRFTDVGYMVAGYRAGAWLSGSKSMLAALTLCAGYAGAHLVAESRTAHNWQLLLAATAATGLVPWLVGRYTTARGAYIADLEQQARLHEHAQRTALARAVADERAAIARDLHDVISHHVSAIGMHAGAARLTLAGTGDTAATRSLAAVESSSRAAMVDLRRQLDLLHGREDDGQRQPGLADIEGLIEYVRAAGLSVTVTVHGTVAPLPDSLDLTLYRIVQEMLTNALRHGDGERATLALDYRPNRVTIEARNPIPTGTPQSTEMPRGLSGIRQRAELYSGTVRYGPETNPASWCTRVCLPIGGS